MRKDVAVKTKICFALLGGDAGMTGCASLAIKDFDSRYAVLCGSKKGCW